MSAWNLMGLKNQVPTASASVSPVSMTTRPVNCSARWKAWSTVSPRFRRCSITASTYSA